MKSLSCLITLVASQLRSTSLDLSFSTLYLRKFSETFSEPTYNAEAMRCQSWTA